MRTKPLLGKKLWFGPRTWGGWGWTPVSWEGWVVVALTGVAAIVLEILYADPDPITPAVLLVLAICLVCWLKGTSPGGPAAARRYKIQQERAAEDRQRRED
jgi:hypothetical protein